MAAKKRKTGKKSPNGEGSIWKKPNGRYAIAVTVPGSHGRKRLKATALSYDLAQIEKQRLIAEARRGVLTTSRATVEQVGNLYIDSKTFSPNTLSAYRRDLKNIGALKAAQVRRLTPVMVAKWMVEAKGRLDGRACESAAQFLKLICRYATELEIIAASPFKSTIPKSEPKEIHPFSDAECVQILNAALTKRMGAVVVLAITCGMRQGEIFGLTWGDVDLETGMLRIRRQITECDGKQHTRIPKTRRSVRTVSLPAYAVHALRLRWAAAQKGDQARPEELVFQSKNGTAIYRTNFNTGTWRPLLKTLGISQRGLHHGRHTNATMLLASGQPVEAVSAHLGHMKPSLTYDQYSHFREGTGQAIAKAMDQLLGCPIVAPEPQIRLHDAS